MLCALLVYCSEVHFVLEMVNEHENLQVIRVNTYLLN